MGITISQSEFENLRDFIYDNYGINLNNKQVLVEGRLGNFVENRGFSSLTQYFDFVQNERNGSEIKRLLERITTNFTYFMREKAHYDFLTEKALPKFTKTIADKDLRIWSAGCSSGEEPYTTAIVLSEFFGAGRRAWDTTVLATDISDNMLNIARRGVYEADKLDRLPTEWRSRYFSDLKDGTFRVSEDLRKQVVFNTFNLMTRALPFKKKLHVIFCRNVMIYFDKPTKEALINRFYDALEPGGYVFIGLSETMTGIQTKFQYIQPSIYTKGG